MKTQYYTAASLDGFIADADNSLDWLFQFTVSADETYLRFLKDVGAIAMGSTTYEWIYEQHIRDGAPQPQKWMYQQPTWVFSSRELPRIQNADVRFVSGDVRPVHEEMRAAARDKNIWLMGGGDLVGQFFDHKLLDEIIVSIASVTLGGGAPLLPRKITAPPLKLREAKTYGTDFVELRYEVSR